LGLLRSLLRAAAGEASILPRVARWRLAVSRKLDEDVILPWPGTLCEGPWIDGVVEEFLPAGALYPTSRVWYRDASKTVALLRSTLTWSGPLLTEQEWRVYTLGGALALTVTDVVSYDGLSASAVDRTVT